MANRWKQNLNEKDVTHEDLFFNRRRLIKNLAGAGITGIGLISGSVIANAKNKGLLRSEGKEYVVNEGDVMEFLFNV